MGKPCAKLVPAEEFDLLMDGGAGFAGFAAGPMGQTPADPDLSAVPDPGLLYPRAVAVRRGGPHVRHPRPRSAMGIRAQGDPQASAGRVGRTGPDGEHRLRSRVLPGRKRSRRRLVVADAQDTGQAPCYDMKALTRAFPFLSTVSRHMNELGWRNYANDHEDANGQFEQNFRYADALTSADRLLFFRYMVQYARPARRQDGDVHAEAVQPSHRQRAAYPFELVGGRHRAVRGRLTDPRGLGLSPMAYNYVGGLLEHATATVAVTCPTVNSYKRMGVGRPPPERTWAPSYVSYGGNNRTQLLRFPEGGRVEYRGCDGSANPYLALTALLAAGLDGIDRAVDPGEPNTDNLHALDASVVAAAGIHPMPPTLLHAVEELTKDQVSAVHRAPAPAASTTWTTCPRQAGRVPGLPRASFHLGTRRPLPHALLRRRLSRCQWPTSGSPRHHAADEDACGEEIDEEGGNRRRGASRP